jgi:membrane protein
VRQASTTPPASVDRRKTRHSGEAPTGALLRRVRGFGARLFHRLCDALRDTLWLFIEKRGQSRGAAIAFYAVTSMAPVLLLIIAVAGLIYGQDAARGAIYAQFRTMLGAGAADMVQRVVASARYTDASIAATAIGIAVILVTTSGVFLELEDALNALWDVDTAQLSWWDMAQARLVSFGLVLALGLLLVISLVIDAGLNAAGGFINSHFPLGTASLFILNNGVSYALVSFMFGSIYRILPAKPIRWRTAISGALVTAGVYQVGKILIALYLGSRMAASSLGAAGALLALFLWVYYAAEIFLLGAAFTRVVFAEGEDEGD